MSSVQHLREFIRERLSAAAEEIFSEFEKTIVQYEGELDRQRKLLDVTWKQKGNLQTAAISPKHDSEVDEAVQDDQQFCSQEKDSNLGLEKPECAHIKEEEEELPTKAEEEPLLQDEAVAHGENNHSDPELNRDNIQSYTNPVEEQYCCKTCGETFQDKTKLTVHMRRHSHRRLYSCQTCGKSFFRKAHLLCHIRIHTGEKPYSCQVCGKCFSRTADCMRHMRTHTGEKPYSCQICGKCFSHTSACLRHMRTHTGEKPHSCVTCGKGFTQSSALLRHMRTHTGEKPYSCQTCGKGFPDQACFLGHIRNCPAIDWQPVQDVPGLSPDNSWEKLQQPSGP